jgi:hypothetical protein
MNEYKKEKDNCYMIHPKAILAGCTPTKVGGSSEWSSIVNGAKENRANF